MATTTWLNPWPYLPGDTVLVYGVEYRCTAFHFSRVFGDDMFNRKFWVRQ